MSHILHVQPADRRVCLTDRPPSNWTVLDPVDKGWGWQGTWLSSPTGGCVLNFSHTVIPPHPHINAASPWGRDFYLGLVKGQETRSVAAVQRDTRTAPPNMHTAAPAAPGEAARATCFIRCSASVVPERCLATLCCGWRKPACWVTVATRQCRCHFWAPTSSCRPPSGYGRLLINAEDRGEA